MPPRDVRERHGLPLESGDRRRRGPARLHEGHRGALPRRGAAARAAIRSGSGKLHLHPDRRADRAPASRNTSTTQTGCARLAARINARFAGAASSADHPHGRASRAAKQVYEYYRAADVCFVSSLHDGMNLVAKEFVVVARRRARRAGAEPVHRRGARAAGGDHRQSLRHRRVRRGAARWRSTMPAASSASACG